MLLLDILGRLLKVLELIEQEALVFPLLMKERRDEKTGKSSTQKPKNADETLTLMICCRSCAISSLRP